MPTIFSTQETITKTLPNGKTYEVTQPIRHAALASFPPEMTRRQKRQAIRQFQKAVKRYQKQQHVQDQHELEAV